MPFVDVAYGYNKGDKQTEWQAESERETGWLYGAGLRLKFWYCDKMLFFWDTVGLYWQYLF